MKIYIEGGKQYIYTKTVQQLLTEGYTFDSSLPTSSLVHSERGIEIPSSMREDCGKRLLVTEVYNNLSVGASNWFWLTDLLTDPFNYLVEQIRQEIDTKDFLESS